MLQLERTAAIPQHRRPIITPAVTNTHVAVPEISIGDTMAAGCDNDDEFVNRVWRSPDAPTANSPSNLDRHCRPHHRGDLVAQRAAQTTRKAIQVTKQVGGVVQLDDEFRPDWQPKPAKLHRRFAHR